jgi:hypothetical protein
VVDPATLQKMKQMVNVAGARASNAGDDFHVLWAARRALRLLDRGSGLSLLRVEGMSPLDTAATSSEPLLGVDVAEYFGGATFLCAERVVLYQLK